ATLPVVVSPNGTNAAVRLDASHSSDPDLDPLHYYWYEQAHGTPSAVGVLATLTVPVGPHSFLLAADAGPARSTNSITVAVITSTQAVERFATAATNGVSPSRALMAALNAALASIDRRNPNSAINQLSAFQNQVRAQLASLNAALAANLIQAAQDIIEA